MFYFITGIGIGLAISQGSWIGVVLLAACLTGVSYCDHRLRKEKKG